MSYTALKILHILGVAALFMALGGLCLSALAGGRGGPLKGPLKALHGLALLLLLITGIALIFQLGMGQGMPMGWLVGKLIIWLVLGGITVLPLRKPGTAKWLVWLLPLLALVAAWLAFYKPF